MRFDGSIWTYYDSTNSPLREFSNVICASGYVWILGNNSLNRFDGTTFTTWNASNSSFPAAPGIMAIDKDNLGNIWFIAGNSNTLCKFDGISFSMFTIPAEYLHDIWPTQEFYIIKTGPQNKSWLSGNHNLLKFDGVNWTKYNTPTFRPGADFRYPVHIPATMAAMVIKSNSSKWFVNKNYIMRPFLFQFNK